MSTNHSTDQQICSPPGRQGGPPTSGMPLVGVHLAGVHPPLAGVHMYLELKWCLFQKRDLFSRKVGNIMSTRLNRKILSFFNEINWLLWLLKNLTKIVTQKAKAESAI